MREFGEYNLQVRGEPGEFPIEVQARLSPLSAMMPLIFIVGIGVVLVTVFWGADGVTVPGFVLIGVSVVAAFVILRRLRGVFSTAHRRFYRITEDTVTYEGRGLLGGRGWTEPLANYTGVRWDMYRKHRGNNSSGRRRTPRDVNIVALDHADPARRVPLFRKIAGQADLGTALSLVKEGMAASRGSEADQDAFKTRAEGVARGMSSNVARDAWEAWAQALDLPAIDARSGQEVVREGADVDKSVRELAQEGKLDTGYSDTPPSEELSLDRGGDGAAQELRVTFHAMPQPVIIWILTGIGAVLAVVGIFQFDFGVLFGGVLFGGAGYGIRVMQLKFPRRLVLDRRAMRYEDPGRQRRNFEMPLDRIETVDVVDADAKSAAGNTLKLGGKTLLIGTDQTEIRLGEGLSEESLRWLRSFLLAAIANA